MSNHLAMDRDRFLRDVKNHKMHIMQDEGVYRHIHMSSGSSVHHFNITTVPGYLMFTGDMGSFVFSRERDMFGFFRSKWGRADLVVNYDYWSEKLEATDTRGAHEEYSSEQFKLCVQEDFDAYLSACSPDVDDTDDWAKAFRNDAREARSVLAEFFQEVEGYSYDGDYRLLYEYSGKISRLLGGNPFEDFEGFQSSKVFTLRYKWACWAIVYTIRQYALGGDRFARQAAHDKLILKGKI